MNRREHVGHQLSEPHFSLSIKWGETGCFALFPPWPRALPTAPSYSSDGSGELSSLSPLQFNAKSRLLKAPPWSERYGEEGGLPRAQGRDTASSLPLVKQGPTLTLAGETGSQKERVYPGSFNLIHTASA